MGEHSCAEAVESAPLVAIEWWWFLPHCRSLRGVESLHQLIEESVGLAVDGGIRFAVDGQPQDGGSVPPERQVTELMLAVVERPYRANELVGSAHARAIACATGSVSCHAASSRQFVMY